MFMRFLKAQVTILDTIERVLKVSKANWCSRWYLGFSPFIKIFFVDEPCATKEERFKFPGATHGIYFVSLGLP